MRGEYKTEFGLWIKEWCAMHKISIQELCERAGVKRDNVYRFARGNTKYLDPDTVDKLGAYMGNDALGRILGFIHKAHIIVIDDAESSQLIQVTNKERIFFEQIRELNDPMRQIAETLIGTMRSQNRK